jgi:ferrous iron transport protein B
MSLAETTLSVRENFRIDYGEALETQISHLINLIGSNPEILEKYPVRWVAIKLLEEDRDIQIKLLAIQGGADLIQQSKQHIARLQTSYGDDLDVAIAGRRYEWINQLVHTAVQRPATASVSFSDRLDSILTHRYLGIPIFLVVMWAVFKLTAEVSAPYLDWIDGVITGPLTNWVGAIFGAMSLGGTWVESLFVDGIIAGVGGVLVFVPVLTFLYLSLAILEDTGYMSRGAYVMDRVMSAIGLHGKSFLPMLVGFGCTVPAFYATRTLENEKDRILTGLLVPFMSCGARLPVYILFGAIFFPGNPGTAVFGMYLLGIVMALTFGIILRKTVFKSKEISALIIELPPYRLPNMKSVGIYVQKRVGTFLRNATTIILGTSILIWILMSTPVVDGETFAEVGLENSLFAAVNRVTAPVLKPLGFGNWQASSALLTGFVAKEVVVSTLSQVYDVEPVEGLIGTTTFLEDLGAISLSFWGATVDTIKSLPLIVGINLFADEGEAEPTALMGAIRSGFVISSNGHATLAALAFMVFVLLYTPCMVAIAAERQELGMKWTWVSIFGQLALAWVMAFVVFQGGLVLGLG